MEKARAIFIILLAFVIGFLTGFTVALLTSRDKSENVALTFGTQSQVTNGPISIETMEKIEDLKENLRLDPKNPAGWLKLGNIYFDYHHDREAIGAYSQYLSLKPEDSHVRTRMGTMLRGVGDFDGAIEEFWKVAQSDLTDGESRFQLGLILLQDKREVKKAIKAWEDYLQVEPKGERANWVRGQIRKMRNVPPVD